MKSKRDKRVNGEGTYQVLPNGKIRYTIMMGRLPNGKKYRPSVTGKSKEECLRKMRAKLKKDSYSLHGEAREQTLLWLCEEHLKYDCSLKDYIKPTSADRRACTIRNQIATSELALEEIGRINSVEIKNFVEDLLKKGLSVSSVEKVFNIINGAYKWAYKQKIYGDDNPCEEIEAEMRARFRKLKQRNSADGVVIVLSQEEIEKVLKAVNSRWPNGSRRYNQNLAYLIEFLLETGIRIGEACALKRKHWNPESKTLDIEETRHLIQNPKYKEGSDEKKSIPNEDIVKNAHRRTLVLSERANDILVCIFNEKGGMQDEDYFFLNDRGNLTEPSAVGYRINRVFVTAGLRDKSDKGRKDGAIGGAHIFRRTIATRKYREGQRVEDIAAYLGDTPETILKYYIARTEKIVEGDKVQNVVKL